MLRDFRNWWYRTWGASIPIYVTRKNNDGMVGTFSVAGWLGLPAFLGVIVNVLLWSAVGILKAIEVLF